MGVIESHHHALRALDSHPPGSIPQPLSRLCSALLPDKQREGRRAVWPVLTAECWLSTGVHATLDVDLS